MAGRMTLGEDGGGPRCFLDGEPVHAGTVLEVMLPGEDWLGPRFESEGLEPVFYFGLKGTEDQAKVKLPEGAILRWPEN